MYKNTYILVNMCNYLWIQVEKYIQNDVLFNTQFPNCSTGTCKNAKDYLIIFIVQKCLLYHRLYMLALCETKEAKNSHNFQSNSSAGTCYLGCYAAL